MPRVQFSVQYIISFHFTVEERFQKDFTKGVLLLAIHVELSSVVEIESHIVIMLLLAVNYLHN